MPSEQMDRDAAAVKNALEQYVCNTYGDIARATGLDDSRVMNVLGWVRRPQNARALGWTVPHVRRGRHHTFRVAMVTEDQDFTPEEVVEIGQGGYSTLATIATMGENEAHALQVVMRQMDGHSAQHRRIIRNLRSALQDVVTYSREAADIVNDELVTV